MPRIIVDVMPKAEISDPQGQAITAALTRLGVDGVGDVRQGKRFELNVSGEISPETLTHVETAAEKLLSNPVIEEYTVRVEQ